MLTVQDYTGAAEGGEGTKMTNNSDAVGWHYADASGWCSKV